MTDCVVVLVTAGSATEAEHIAETLVGERLAACVNVVGPMRSVYRWNGAVQRDEEWLLVAKTRAERVAALRRRVRDVHSYDLPETVALSVVDGAPDYLAWVCRETAD